MMVDRRQSCNTKRPYCMTVGFMFGMIIGSCISHINASWLGAGLAVAVATVVFHFTYVRNFNIKQMVSKVIKKGF
jgi:hypothetical protein